MMELDLGHAGRREKVEMCRQKTIEVEGICISNCLGR